MHGSPIGHRGLRHIAHGLSLHPNIVSLDLGDCQLIDSSIPPLADLLPPNGAKKSLKELTLSANPAITVRGWTRFCIAMAAGCSLRVLNLDYNQVGDHGAACLAVVIAGNTTLQRLDLEGCGISERGAKTIHELIKNYPVSLKELILTENKISTQTTQEIQDALELANTPITSIKNPLDSRNAAVKTSSSTLTEGQTSKGESSSLDTFASSSYSSRNDRTRMREKVHDTILTLSSETETETTCTDGGSPSTLRGSDMTSYFSESTIVSGSPFSNVTDSDDLSVISVHGSRTWPSKHGQHNTKPQDQRERAISHGSKYRYASKSLDRGQSSSRSKANYQEQSKPSTSGRSRHHVRIGSASYAPSSLSMEERVRSVLDTYHQDGYFSDIEYNEPTSKKSGANRQSRKEYYTLKR